VFDWVKWQKVKLNVLLHHCGWRDGDHCYGVADGFSGMVNWFFIWWYSCR
jgi:hypothetical protein